MSTTAAETRPRRPRDRKRRIEEAAALAFAEHGYHSVGMQDIASAVGISAPALYRHFPNKYALFVQTTFALAHRLVEDSADAASGELADAADARVMLDALLDSFIGTTMALRTTGGIYRWEGRYLERADRDRLTAEFRTLRERVQVALGVLRPELDEEEASFAALGALSVIASITAHRTVLAAGSLRVLLAGAAWRCLEADLPAEAAERRAAAVPASARPSRREQLVDTAIRMFASRGYNEVTIGDLASEVDLTPSGVYRHFTGKSDLLLAACERAAVELERATLRVRESASSPVEALHRLSRAYVDHTFEHLALVRVYFSEIGNLAPEEQRRLRAMQRAHIADWVALLQAVRPELSTREATILVHAGLGVVADRTPLLPERDALAATRLARLVEAVLGV